MQRNERARGAHIHIHSQCTAGISSVHFHVQLSAFTSLSPGKHYRTRERESSCSSSVGRTKTSRQTVLSRDPAGGREIFQFYFVSRNRLFSREIEAFTRDRCFIPVQHERLGNFCLKECKRKICADIYIYTYIK